MNLWKKYTKPEYDAHPGLRSSDLKLLLRSGLHFKTAVDSRDEKEQTAAQRIGELVHGCVLEPDIFLPRLLISPDFDRRTKAGKEGYAEFHALAPEHSSILTRSEYELITSITDSVRSNGICDSIFQQGHAEVSGIAVDEMGLQRKIQPDWRRDDGIIIDLKTTKDASPRGFLREIIEYKYALQSVYYLDTANLIEVNKYHTWLWIAVEKDPPYAVGVYQLDANSLFGARQLMNTALNKYLEFNTKKIWDGYHTAIQMISLPTYALEI